MIDLRFGSAVSYMKIIIKWSTKILQNLGVDYSYSEESVPNFGLNFSWSSVDCFGCSPPAYFGGELTLKFDFDLNAKSFQEISLLICLRRRRLFDDVCRFSKCYDWLKGLSMWRRKWEGSVMKNGETANFDVSMPTLPSARVFGHQVYLRVL